MSGVANLSDKRAKKQRDKEQVQLRPMRCLHCTCPNFNIFMTEAHPTSSIGHMRIACAGCKATLMEQ